jgi:formate dehydrogenase subunit gamma
MIEQQSTKASFQRYSGAQRFEHWVLTVAFIGMALTGLPQRYAGEAWGQMVIQALGGIESVRILHRFLAALLIAEVIVHVVSLCYRLIVLRQSADLLVRARDFRDLRDALRYNLGMTAQRPRMEWFNFNNKFGYWFVVVSVIILMLTGLALWNPMTTANVLSGEAIPVLQSIHSNQALLAVLIVVIWHTYNVLIGRVNLSMFSGKLSRKIMEEDHGAVLDRLDQGETSAPAQPSGMRQRVFLLVAMVVSAVVIVGLVSFVTYR